MTQKINNTGVKMLGIALRIMLGNKRALAEEHRAADLYFHNPTLSRAKLDNEFDMKSIEGLLENVDGCYELLPIYDRGTEAAGPVIVGSSEERTGLLKQIADLEVKLDQADKSFAAQGERFQKAWDEKNSEIEKLKKVLDLFKIVNNQISTSNMKRAEKIDSLISQLKQTQETVDTLVKTNDNVCDERDSLRSDLVKSERRTDIANKVMQRVQNRYSQLERMINEYHFNSAEKIIKLIREVNKPWVDEPEPETLTAWGFPVGPTPSHDNCRCAVTEVAKVNVAEPCKTNDTLTVKLNVDISEFENVFIGEAIALSIDHDSMLVNLRIDNKNRADTFRKIADQIDLNS